MTSSSGQRTGSARFRPRARLIGLIGEELISDEPVAVVELVKNSFDADASKVSVRFSSDLERGRITVEDDGHGMTLETVLNTWFEPGTLSKQRADRSPGGRIYQGAKGIGRFASARLARTLVLESNTGEGPDAVTVVFDWGAFERNEGFLDELEIAWEVGGIPDLPKGTRLTLDELRKRWGQRDYEELHSRLSRLISPFGEVHGFSIDLSIPGHPDLSGEIQAPAILSRPRYVLAGRVDAQGRFSGRLEHEGVQVEVFEDHQLGSRGSAPACGPFGVEIRAWDRDREGLGALSTELNQGIMEIRRILNDYSGVSVYRDGFRVHPYGQQGNDWLTLDNRSRQVPALRLANNQVVGAIQISRADNPDLRDRSNREGLVVNRAYEELRGTFVEVLSLLEGFRYKARPRRETRSRPDPLFEPFDLGETVREARSALGTGHPVVSLIEGLERQVTEGVERVQDVFSRLLMSAGLGQMVDIVIHEIGAPLGKINRQIDLLERHVDKCSDSTIRKQVAPMFASLRTWLEQIHSLRQRLDPQTAGRRTRASTFDVLQEVGDTFELYSAVLGAQHIDWHVEAPGGEVRVHMPRAALGQILANLVDNAIFWIVRTRGSGNGGSIRVGVERLATGFTVTVSDDGPGVDVEDRNAIFEPYFTRKPNGIGLGLYIARLVIEPYGRLTYREDCELSGACFRASFERGVSV